MIIGRTEPITDDYDLGDRIGQAGQYGYAQLGIHKETKQKVAIKIIEKKKFKKQHYAAFKNEVALLKTLDHPYIVKGFGAYEDDDYLYLPMEYCAGGELFNRIQDKTRYSEKMLNKFYNKF